MKKRIKQLVASGLVLSMVLPGTIPVKAANVDVKTVALNFQTKELDNVTTWNFEDCEVGGALPDGFMLTQGGYGKIVEDNGNKVLEIGSSWQYPNMYIGNAFAGDVEFEARFKVIKNYPQNGGGIELHIREQMDDGKHGYTVCYEPKDSNNATLILRKRVGSVMDPVKKVTLSLEDTQAWHKIRIRMTGNMAEVYFDDELALEQELTGFDKGKVGLCAYYNSVYFDDVTLKKASDVKEEPVIDKTKIVVDDTNRDKAQFAITLNGNKLQKITMADQELVENKDYTSAVDKGVQKILLTESFLESLETQKPYRLEFDFGSSKLGAEVYILAESQYVTPINWDNLNTNPVKNELGEDLQVFIQYVDKYIVNKWWNEKQNYDAQADKEYLDINWNVQEYAIRPIAHQVRTLAASLKLNVYDEIVAGVSEEQAKEMAVKLIKSVAKRHKVNDPSGWGNQWQSAFWAADIGQAGWMLWDELEPQDREYVRAMVEYEANRFIGYKVPYYKDRDGKDISAGDSKSEENSWNADLLVLAAVMMPEHNNEPVWMSKAVELMLSAFSVPEDCTSEEVVNGFKLKKMMNGYNMESDGMVINHGMMHPDYLSTIYQNVVTAVTCGLGGMDTPKAALHNTDIVYEAFVNYDLAKYDKVGQHIYKRDENGNATFELVYPQGTDWGTDRQINFYLLDVMADGLGFDKNCEVKGKDWAMARMPEMLRMQRRGGEDDLSSLTGEYYRAGDQDTYTCREEWVSYHAMSAYMSLWAVENDLVKVTDKDFSNIRADQFTSVKLNAPERMEIGTEVETTITPNKEIPYLDESFATITYTSSNPKVVEVSEKGVLTALSKGEAEITVTVDFDGVVLSDTVTVSSISKPVFGKLVYEENFDEGKIPENFDIKNGNWVVEEEEGNYILRQKDKNKGGLFIGDAFGGDFVLEAKVRMPGNKVTYSGTGVYFRDQGTEKDGYSINIGQRSGSGSWGIEMRERSTKGGIVNSTFKNGEVSRNEWHTLRVQVWGNVMTVFMDGEQVLEKEYTTYPEGKIGLWSYKELSDFDDIKVFTATEEVDKEWLAELIDYAESQKENEHYQYVVPVVKAAFEKALAEAVAVNEDAEATQAEVDAAYDKLLAMTHYLGFIGDSSNLKVLVDAAKGLNEKLYTEETWAVFQDALTKAEEVLADENALQAEIDVARDVLQKAMDALDEIPVDKTKLQKLVDKSKKYEDAIKDYTPATADIFKGALAHARDILANDATQEEIDAAYAGLQNAIFGLRLIPDKGKLEDLIKDAEKVDTADYTAESVAAFTAALDNAKAVFADENATEDEVKAAEKALKKAQKNLVAKVDADKKDNDKKADDKVASADGNNKPADKAAAKTGDVNTALPAAVTGAAALAVLMALKKRR